MSWAIEVLRYMQVIFLVQDVEALFHKMVSQSASCLPDLDCPRTFTTKNSINDVIRSAREMPCDKEAPGDGIELDWLM